MEPLHSPDLPNGEPDENPDVDVIEVPEPYTDEEWAATEGAQAPAGLASIRTHGRLVETLKTGDVIYCASFHHPFALIVAIEPRMGGLDLVFERDGQRSVRSYRRDARVDLVVETPEIPAWRDQRPSP